MATGKSVRVLVNRKSGLSWSFDSIEKACARHWDKPGTELTFQFSRSREDGIEKAERAVSDGIDVLLVVGGDGTVNTIGSCLVGSSTALGVIPVGSGNGFARHFSIPLVPEKAVKALSEADVQRIDVGMVNDRPFLVTCSMAWDAQIVRTFDKFPVRGIIPYLFAGAYEILDFKPQPMTVTIDSGEKMEIPDAAVFTVANLTQFGAGAKIAPHAKADDGMLELIAARLPDMPVILANLPRVFYGTMSKMPQMIKRSFRHITVRRQFARPIQVDGELIDAPPDVTIKVKTRCLNVLVPRVSRRI